MRTHDNSQHLVVVIDDDVHVREALDGLFRSVGMKVELYESAVAYQKAVRRDSPCCIVLDVRLPGLNGLEFQQELALSSRSPPIVFISGHADQAIGARAKNAGAVDFLSKPVRDHEMLSAVRAAFACEAHRRNECGTRI